VDAAFVHHWRQGLMSTLSLTRSIGSAVKERIIQGDAICWKRSYEERLGAESPPPFTFADMLIIVDGGGLMRGSKNGQHLDISDSMTAQSRKDNKKFYRQLRLKISQSIPASYSQ
jgi:hypothetical protein